MRAGNDSRQLAIDSISRKHTRGIPTFGVHVMDTDVIDALAGVPPGTYAENPERTYIRFKNKIGVNCLDQFLPENALTMTKKGYDGTMQRGATTGLEKIILDGIVIDSPEAVVEHMERFVFPEMQCALENFDMQKEAREILTRERLIQAKLGDSILKTGYGYIAFPRFRYGKYGYTNYFMAYALYPEIMEKDFSLHADYAELFNTAAVKAITEGGLPLLYRLDHDMADSRGPLVNMNSLEKLWFPHFKRAIRRVAEIPGMNLIWHCDGNIMPMVPGLIECGVKGFQGFQYEAGMDYPAICKMNARDGDSMIIVAGVSVTGALPFGTPEDVKKEMQWLVEHGPETGLFLGASSSVTPNTNRENIITFVEGLRFYRIHGRKNI